MPNQLQSLHRATLHTQTFRFTPPLVSVVCTQLGTQVERQRKPGTLPNRGHSPIGECVFKQMLKLKLKLKFVGAYKPTYIHHTPSQLAM